MVTNVLLLKTKDAGEVETVMGELMRMKGNIKPLLNISVNKNLRDTGFDIIMTASYNSLTDMESYLKDPLHLEVAKNIGSKIEKQASACYEVN